MTTTTEAPTTTRTPVLAATRWNSNADMILDLVKLGYLHEDWVTLDPTWGRGLWWSRWQPKELIKHDLFTLDGVDYRDLPETDNSIDVVTFDPPYVSIGGRKPSRMAEMHDRFGMLTTPTSPAELQDSINWGLRSIYRVLKPKGIALVKNQDYVSSGKLWLGTHHTLTAALALGFQVQDRLEHIGSPRPQPDRARQVHARRNLSTLFVLRKPR